MEPIFIRHAEPTDIPAIKALFEHPDTYAQTLQVPHPCVEHWRKRIEPSQPGVFQLVACIDSHIVGQLTLEVCQRERRRHVATFGIAVAHTHQGKGIGNQLMRETINMCDNWLNISRIELTVFADNTGAIALYKKFGFEIEGTGKKYAFRNGEYVDCTFMARVTD